MRPRALSLLLLLGAPLTGCDATGGSTDSIVAPKPTFAVQARAPGAGREGVPIAVSISVTFTADIDPSTVTTGVITANDRSFGDLEVDGATLRFTPTGGLLPGTAYAIALSPDIRGVNGVALGPYPVWGFKTAGTTPVHDTLQLVRPRR